jgi:hypothetical protein
LVCISHFVSHSFLVFCSQPNEANAGGRCQFGKKTLKIVPGLAGNTFKVPFF